MKRELMTSGHFSQHRSDFKDKNCVNPLDMLKCEKLKKYEKIVEDITLLESQNISSTVRVFTSLQRNENLRNREKCFDSTLINYFSICFQT